MSDRSCECHGTDPCPRLTRQQPKKTYWVVMGANKLKKGQHIMWRCPGLHDACHCGGGLRSGIVTQDAERPNYVWAKAYDGGYAICQYACEIHRWSEIGYEVTSQ